MANQIPNQLPTPYLPGVDYWAEEPTVDSPPPKPRKRPRDYVPTAHEELHKKLQKTMEVLGSGSYFTVYVDQENPDIVCKAFHGKKTGFSPKVLKPLFSNSIESYKKVAETRLAVAEIVNPDTVLTDLCIKQKRVINPINPRDDGQIAQIAKFFEVAYAQKLEMDLQPQNFRADAAGKVFLVDFVEENVGVDILLTKACRAWVSLCKQNGITREECTRLLSRLHPTFKMEPLA